MNAPVNIDYAALIREDTPDGFLVNSRLYQDPGVFQPAPCARPPTRPAGATARPDRTGT